jgi:hypothetical protein
MARVVGSESIATGDFILVSHGVTEDPVFDSLSDWKAKVLEVRALDKEHVYIRVVGLIGLKIWRVGARTIMARMSSCLRIKWMSSMHNLRTVLLDWYATIA